MSFSVKNLTSVRNLDSVARGTGGGESLAVLGDVNDGSAVNASTLSGGAGVGGLVDGDFAERRKRDQTTADAVVFKDPLGTLLAKGLLARKSLRGRLTGALVGDVGSTAGGAGGVDLHDDFVALVDLDVKGATGCWVPLVEGTVRRAVTVHGPGNTSLENNVAAVTAVNTDPDGTSVCGTAITARRNTDRGDVGDAVDVVDTRVGGGGTRPVAVVADILGAIVFILAQADAVGSSSSVDCVRKSSALTLSGCEAGSTPLESLAARSGRGGGKASQKKSGSSGGLHDVEDVEVL